MINLMLGNCLDKLKELDDDSVDSIVTDPPYELGFMGKGWDKTGIANNVELWKECLRVLKPGGHLLAFSGSRTYHRMTCAIEDAGFEVRDQIMWVYGSGFPKSLDVSKAIDKAAGARRTEKIGVKPGHEEFANRETKGHLSHENANEGWNRPWQQKEDADNYHYNFAPATEEANQWEGWGTALKPAHEPICVARKPLAEKTVAKNVLKYGTGAINIDECRVETADSLAGGRNSGSCKATDEGWNRPYMNDEDYLHKMAEDSKVRTEKAESLGRWPANLIHDGSGEVLECFPEAKGQQGKVTGKEPSSKTKNAFGDFEGRVESEPRNDAGSAARFFYCAKASKKDRGEGNTHPTVKPTELMKYLTRLVTPPTGVVLDPFMGSGSTGVAAVSQGFNFIGIEMDEGYIGIAKSRIEGAIGE